MQDLIALPLIEKDAVLDQEDALFQHPVPIDEDGLDLIDVEEERISTAAEKRMKVISLQSVPSSGACRKIIKNFANSKFRRIISNYSV